MSSEPRYSNLHIAEQLISSSSAIGADDQSMVKILSCSITQFAYSWFICYSVDPILSRQKLMKKLEKK